MLNSRVAKLLAIIFILSGCANSGVKVDSRVQTSSLPPIKRMLVNINVESRNFNKNLASGMTNSLVKALNQCGVSSSIYIKDPLDLNAEQTFANQSKDFNPDSILTIVRTGGQVIISDGGNNANFDVMMRLSKLAPKSEIWTAKLDVRVLTQNLFTDDVKSGERLGQQFFEAMKKDRVLCRGD